MYSQLDKLFFLYMNSEQVSCTVTRMGLHCTTYSERAAIET